MSNFDDLAALEDAWGYFRQKKAWYANAVVASVSGMSRFVMTRLNRLRLDGIERFQAALAHRDRGLLTFSNHVSLLDDPWLVSCFGLPVYDRLRWVAADARNFFSSDLKGMVFSAGKCVPVVRGLGLEQPGFGFLSERLQEGAWVHLFPEGGRTRESTARLKTPFKPGIGKLIDEAEPWVLPFYHLGMDAVLPVGARLPRRGNDVTVHFGEAVCLDRARIDDIVSDAPDSRERIRRLTAWSQSLLAAMERRYRPAVEPSE